MLGDQAETSCASPDAARAVLGLPGWSCRQLAHHEGLPSVYRVVAQGPSPSGRAPAGLKPVRPEGIGVSLSEEGAVTAAVAEAVERQAALAAPSDGELVRSARVDLPEESVDPSLLALFSPGQYRRFPQLDPLTETKEVDWRPAWSLTRGRRVLVPAALVHLGLARRPPNNFLAGATTTGFASHLSAERAVLAGLCEVLERDALTVAWRNQLPTGRLEAAGTQAEELIRGPLGECGAEFFLFGLPSDTCLSVVLALAWGRGVPPAAAVGVACRPQPLAAAERALLEAAQVLSWLRIRRPASPPSVRALADHGALYAQPGPARRLRRWLESGPTVALSDLASSPHGAGVGDLATTVGHLAGLDLEVLTADLTPAELASTGWRVMRTLIPGTVDIEADARLPRLGGRRLYELPVRLGLRPKPCSESELCLLPVPLA